MRDKTSTYFYLFIVRITLKSTEKLGREENRGGWCWEGSETDRVRGMDR